MDEACILHPVRRRGCTIYCTTPVTPAAFCFRTMQIHGTLAEPRSREREILDYEANTGCQEDERGFSLNTHRYGAKPPPPELVSSSGWYFKPNFAYDAFIGFGNSSTKAICSWELPCAGGKGRLDIGYIRSYESMGALKVDVNTEGNPIGTTAILDGMWETHASVRMYSVVPIPGGSGKVTVTFEILSPEEEDSYAEVFSTTAVTNSGVAAGIVRGDRKIHIMTLQCC